MGEKGEILITLAVIILVAILMFVVPMMTLADKTDEVTQIALQTLTIEFVDNIRTTGKIEGEEYDKFLSSLAATGNAYEVELEVKSLDENTGKKTIQVANSKVGENEYVSEYTTQIEVTLFPTGEDEYGTKYLKEGDIISVKVKNSSLTLSQTLKNFYLKLSGNDTYIIAAEHAGIVAVNGD